MQLCVGAAQGVVDIVFNVGGEGVVQQAGHHRIATLIRVLDDGCGAVGVGKDVNIVTQSARQCVQAPHGKALVIHIVASHAPHQGVGKFRPGQGGACSAVGDRKSVGAACDRTQVHRVACRADVHGAGVHGGVGSAPCANQGRVNGCTRAYIQNVGPITQIGDLYRAAVHGRQKGVGPRTAGERVAAAGADEDVVGDIPDDHVVGGIAGAVDGGLARQRQVFNMAAAGDGAGYQRNRTDQRQTVQRLRQGVRDRAHDRVCAATLHQPAGDRIGHQHAGVDDHVAHVIHPKHIIPASADHGVRAHTTIEHIGRVIAGQGVAQGVSCGIDSSSACQGQVLDIDQIDQAVGQAGPDGVGALACGLHNAVRQRVHHIGVIAHTPLQRVQTRAADQHIRKLRADQRGRPAAALQAIQAGTTDIRAFDRAQVHREAVGDQTHPPGIAIGATRDPVGGQHDLNPPAGVHGKGVLLGSPRIEVGDDVKVVGNGTAACIRVGVGKPVDVEVVGLEMAGLHHKAVIAQPAGQQVIAGATGQGVISSAAYQGVIALPTPHVPALRTKGEGKNIRAAGPGIARQVPYHAPVHADRVGGSILQTIDARDRNLGAAHGDPAGVGNGNAGHQIARAVTHLQAAGPHGNGFRKNPYPGAVEQPACRAGRRTAQPDRRGQDVGEHAGNRV